MTNFRFNSRGSIVGQINSTEFHIHSPVNMERVASRTYRIQSSKGNVQYLLYIERMWPKRYRCQCNSYLFYGTCKHAEAAFSAERMIRKTFPRQLHAEDRRRRKALLNT